MDSYRHILKYIDEKENSDYETPVGVLARIDPERYLKLGSTADAVWEACRIAWEWVNENPPPNVLEEVVLFGGRTVTRSRLKRDKLFLALEKRDELLGVEAK